jgi:methyl-accepting chemotaxis protein
VSANSDARSAPAGAKHNRSTKNLLVYRSFQLKYATFIVTLTVLIAAPLGGLLYRQAAEMVRVAGDANGAARDAVEQARQVNTRLAFEAMTSAKGDPARVDRVNRENAVATAGLDARAKSIMDQAAALEKQRTVLVSTLGVGLAVLVVLVGLMGLLFTHRVAGPIHRMRKLFKEVGDGEFTPSFAQLRKGDDLQDFFAEFAQMVQRLRDRQKVELDRLDKAIKRIETAGADTDSIADLRVARDAMRQAIARSIPPPRP